MKFCPVTVLVITTNNYYMNDFMKRLIEKLYLTFY